MRGQVNGKHKGLSKNSYSFVQKEIYNITPYLDVENLIQQAETKYGKLDAAINGAAINGKVARLHENSKAEFERVFQVPTQILFFP